MAVYERSGPLVLIATVLCCALLLPVIAALEEGESCRHLGQAGVCRRFSQCKKTSRVTVCTYGSNEAVVCCLSPLETPVTGSLRPLAAPTGIRKSAQKCKEYGQLTMEKSKVTLLTLDPKIIEVSSPKCLTVVKLIVGGVKTKPGEFPHMAVIGWPSEDGIGYTFPCGGSLISDRYVLTAAHCNVKNDFGFPAKIVRLGEQNLVSNSDGAEPQDYDIESFVSYPREAVKSGLYNDIALIRLTRTVTYTNFIRPACLYDSKQLPENDVIATGYGDTEDHGYRSDELLKVALQVYPNQVCADGHRLNRKARRGIRETQMCAGSTAGGKDTCQGDSGGPLQITKSDNPCLYYVVGITSYGGVCGSSVPAVYTKVFSYLDWIEPIVWP